MITTFNPLADKLDMIADSFAVKIRSYNGERAMRTPKQRQQASAARYDQHNLQLALDATRALAKAARNNTLPPEFAQYNTIKAIQGLTSVRMAGHDRSYYAEVYPDHDNHHDNSPKAVALRAWLSDRAGVTEVELEQRRHDQRLQQLLSEVRGNKIDGFFPTPDAVIDIMFQHVVTDDMQGMLVLEPSAGIGSLADRALSHGATTVCFEINHNLCEILELKGHVVVRDNFLECAAVPDFHRVFMNPPFERNLAPQHVRHAYDFLRPRGELLAVLPAVAPRYGQSPKRALQDFDAWLHYECKPHRYTQLSEGAFKNAFCSTGISTTLLRIQK